MPEQPQEQPLVQQPLEQPSPLPHRRRSFEPPRAAHPVRVRVAVCLSATTPSTTSSSFCRSGRAGLEALSRRIAAAYGDAYRYGSQRERQPACVAAHLQRVLCCFAREGFVGEGPPSVFVSCIARVLARGLIRALERAADRVYKPEAIGFVRARDEFHATCKCSVSSSLRLL